MARLIDADFAANYGDGKWPASTETDAVPSFKIFKPTHQSQRYAPGGDFIRRYCTELSHLNRKAGLKCDGLNYPRPIVDYKAIHAETIALF